MSARTRTSPVGASGILAAGLASAAAALFTSRFGVAGTIVGATLTTMIITGGSSVLRFYLQTAAERARSVPDKLRAKSFWRPGGPVASSVSGSQTTTRFRRYSPARRRAMVVGALLAALASFVIAATAVTALEIGAGESLSCWVWEQCPAASSTGQTGTLPSVLGGGSQPAPQSSLFTGLEVTEPPSSTQYDSQRDP